MGDPTIFHHRATTSTSSCTTTSRSIAARTGGSLARYYYHLQLRPEQPDNARGAFTYTGQFTGNAFADFLLGYPTSATSGIGRGDEDGRTNWLHLYAQDDWQARQNLTVQSGLTVRVQPAYVRRGQPAVVDRPLDAGRTLRNRQRRSRHDSSRAPSALLPLIPIPYVTSDRGGWGPGLLDPSAVRLAPRFGFALSLDDSRAVIRGGYGIFLNQWAYSVQTAFARNLPFFFVKQVDVPIQQQIPALRTRDILTSTATGTIGGNIMDHGYSVEYSQTWSGGIQYELFPSTMVEVSYMGTWTLGADNATVHNVPEPGSGPIQPRRPIPQLSRINSIRFDGKSIYHGVTFKAERRLANNYAYNVSYTLSHSKDDASSPGPTESETNFPQNVRNIFDETGEWALSSFDHRHQFIASGVYQLPFLEVSGRLAETVLDGWRVNAIVLAQSRRAVHGQPERRSCQYRRRSGPAPGSAARSQPAWRRTDAGALVRYRAFVLPAPFTFGNAPRNSVIGPGFANVDFALAKTWQLPGASELEFRWEAFNLFNRANFDLPNRIFGNPNFGRIFSAKNPREMQFGVRFAF